jgi:hypothetical protein
VKIDNLLLAALLFKFISFCFYDISGLRLIMQPASFLFLGAYLCLDKKSTYSLISVCLTFSLLALTAAHIFLAQSASEFSLTFLVTLLYGLVCGLAVQAKGLDFLSMLLKYLALIVLFRIIYVDLIFVFSALSGPGSKIIGSFSTLEFAWYPLFEMPLARIQDKAIVLYPLVVAIMFTPNYSRALAILAVSTLAITINFNVAGIVAYFIIFASFLFFRRSYSIFGIISAFMIFLTLLFIEDIQSLIALKSYSFELKMFQLIYVVENFSDFMFGNGIGNVDLKLFREGDLLIENSYLYLLYALGLFSLPIFAYLAMLSMYMFHNLSKGMTPSLFALYACLISILILSGSNPYLFSGSIYVIFYIVSKHNIKAIR